MARKENVWIVDSGCSRHMTGDKNWFSSLKKASKTESIIFGDASTSAILATGLVKVNENFKLKMVASSHAPIVSVMTDALGPLLHMDTVGTARVQSVGGKWYAFVIVDDFS